MTPKQKEKIESVLYTIHHDYWDAKLNLDEREIAQDFIHDILTVVDAFAAIFGENEIETISDEQSDQAYNAVKNFNEDRKNERDEPMRETKQHLIYCTLNLLRSYGYSQNDLCSYQKMLQKMPRSEVAQVLDELIDGELCEFTS